MKEVHNTRVLKIIGEYICCPILALVATHYILNLGMIEGQWRYWLGGIIFLGMAAIAVNIFRKLIFEKVEASNERIEAERKEKLRQMIEEENDPDAYSEYDDTNFS